MFAGTGQIPTQSQEKVTGVTSIETLFQCFLYCQLSENSYLSLQEKS